MSYFGQGYQGRPSLMGSPMHPGIPPPYMGGPPPPGVPPPFAMMHPQQPPFSFQGQPMGPPMAYGPPPIGAPGFPPQGFPPQGPPQVIQLGQQFQTFGPGGVRTFMFQKTVLFVGSIHDDLSDIALRQLLCLIGKVQNWTRIREPSGKLGNFGFCEFETPDATLRALRILGKMTVQGNFMNISVDAKNKEHLEAYLKSQNLPPDLSQVDPAAKQADNAIIEEIKELLRVSAPSMKVEYNVEKPSASDLERSDAVDALVSKELKSAREANEAQAIKDDQAAALKKAEKDKRRREEKLQDTLKAFQAREKTRISEHKHEDGSKKDRAMELDRAREAVKQRNMDSNYDDERDDPKFYKPSRMKDLKKEREAEIEWEIRDRVAAEEEAKMPVKIIQPKPVVSAAKFGFGLQAKPKVVVPVAKVPVDAFGQEDEEGEASKKKRVLVKITYTEEQMRAKALTEEERRKLTKQVIEGIPTKKEDLFSVPIEWEAVNETFVSLKIQPWIQKKITAFIGEEEPSLVEFICGKLLDKSDARGLLQDLGVILDEEAEIFVVKLWRLLLYEIEAQKIGLPSQSEK